MKICADEHIAEKIVRAVRELVLSPGWNLTHVKEQGDGGASDVHWVTKFGKSGGKVILSADTDMFKHPQLLTAIADAGMMVVYLPPRWANSVRHLQAAHLIYNWPKIEAALSTAKAKDVLKVPFNFANAPIEKIPVDYDKAQKKSDGKKSK